MAEPQEEKFSGQLLSEARKKRRWRYKRLSAELNIPERYLEALEEENYKVMPGGDPYIKGYLRAYAKKLGLDPNFIIERYKKNLNNQNTTSNNQSFRHESKFITYKKYIFAITLFFFFLLFIYFSSSCSEDNSLEMAVETYVNEESVEIAPISDEEIKTEENVDSIKDKEEFVVSINLIKEKIEPQITDKTLISEDLLQFYFLEECWVEVYNEYERLVFKLASEETSLEVRSKGPFKVLLGNAKHANLVFNGIVVDLLESSNRENNVSCVVLPSGKCSEFPRSK